MSPKEGISVAVVVGSTTFIIALALWLYAGAIAPQSEVETQQQYRVVSETIMFGRQHGEWKNYERTHADMVELIRHGDGVSRRVWIEGKDGHTVAKDVLNSP